MFRSPLLPDLSDIQPLVSLTGSDSQSLDNMLEVLLMGGLDPMHAMRLLVPPAWHGIDAIDPDLRSFYEYYTTHMEPWDGPAGIVLTDGRYAACTLDRNGLRPARYVITKNRVFTVASETGVWDYKPEDVVRKGKLGPGDMIALDMQTGTLLESKDIDDLLKTRHPYKAWLKKGVQYLETDLVDPRLAAEPFDRETLTLYQKMFNVTQEERDEIIRVLAEDESEAVGSMGDDTPMPVLSPQDPPAVRLLPSAVRAGDQPADRPAARVHRDVAADRRSAWKRTSSCRRPEHGGRHVALGSPILSQRKLRQILALPEITHEFIDLQYDPAEGLKAAIHAHLRAGRAGGSRRQARADAVGPLSGARARSRCMRCSRPALFISTSCARACAASATCSSRRAQRAIRITSRVCSVMAPPPCIRTWRTRCCSR